MEALLRPLRVAIHGVRVVRVVVEIVGEQSLAEPDPGFVDLGVTLVLHPAAEFEDQRVALVACKKVQETPEEVHLLAGGQIAVDPANRVTRPVAHCHQRQGKALLGIQQLGQRLRPIEHPARISPRQHDSCRSHFQDVAFVLPNRLQAGRQRLHSGDAERDPATFLFHYHGSGSGGPVQHLCHLTGRGRDPGRVAARTQTQRRGQGQAARPDSRWSRAGRHRRYEYRGQSPGCAREEWPGPSEDRR